MASPPVVIIDGSMVDGVQRIMAKVMVVSASTAGSSGDDEVLSERCRHCSASSHHRRARFLAILDAGLGQGCAQKCGGVNGKHGKVGDSPMVVQLLAGASGSGGDLELEGE